MDPRQVLSKLNFGRVDGETDTRFEQCFIGTEMLRQVLLPQHSLVVGNKGSGKSAMSRLLTEDLAKVRPLLPKQFEKIYCVPAYGLQSEEYLPGVELRELMPETVDEFRYYWLLYLGLKVSSTLLEDVEMQSMVGKSKNEKAKTAYTTLRRLLADVGLTKPAGMFARVRDAFGKRSQKSDSVDANQQGAKHAAENFKQRTGTSIIAMLDSIDTVLRETNCIVWLMLDKLDLLYLDNIQKLHASIAGLVQLLVQYGNQFRNIHLKVFLRNDIYRQLHIVNKSHLISYTTEMKWRGPLLLKLLVSRAVVDPHVQAYCQEVLGEKIDVTSVILGSEEFVLKAFYAIFERMPETTSSTHQWILKRLVDGTGSSFPRELIHLGNRAVEIQREFNRQEGNEAPTHLIGVRALRDAFVAISQYRCDTYLYAEFPHLAKHFDVFRGSDSSTFHREELYMLFEPLIPKGDDAIRAVYDCGLIEPLGGNVDSSRKFKVPLLYRAGLGITDRRRKLPVPTNSLNR